MPKRNVEMLKTLVMLDDYRYHLIDTISYKDNWWLVFEWLDSTDLKSSTPKRIVLLNPFDYSTNDSGHPYDFFLNKKVPKSVFFDPIELLPNNVVAIDCPEIFFPLRNE